MKQFKGNYKILVKAEDRHLIDSFHRIILWYINQQKNIPYGLVASFLSCLHDAKSVEFEELSTKAVALAKTEAQKLSNQNEYQFAWHPRKETIDEEIIVTDYDTEKVFYECIYAFLMMYQDLKNTKKEDAIIFFYDALTDEYMQRLKLIEGQANSELTTYKRSVIAGILTQAVGYKLTNKEKPTNEEIYQATRNAIAKSAKKQ